MSLDLAKTAVQIEHMAEDMRSRRSDMEARLNRARRQVESFDTGEYEATRARRLGKAELDRAAGR